MERRFLSYDNYRTLVDPPYKQQPVSFDQAALLAKRALDALGVAQSSTPHLLQHGGSNQSREPEIESYSTGLPQPCSSNQIGTSAVAGNNANVNPQGGVGPETRVEGGMQDGSDSEEDTSFCKVCNLPLDSLQKYQRHIRSVGHSQRQMEFDQQKAPHSVHPPGPHVLPHSQQGRQGQYGTIHQYRQEKQQQQGNKLQQGNQKQFGNQQLYLNQQHHGNQPLHGNQQQYGNQQQHGIGNQARYGNQQQHGNQQEIGKQQHYDSVRRTGPGPSGVQHAPQQQGQYRREPEQHAYQRQQHGNRQGLDDPNDRLLSRHKGKTTECPQEAGEENQMEEEEGEEEEDKDDANNLFRCELCDIDTTSAATLRAHYQGRFHKAVQVALDDGTMVTQRFAARLGPKTLLPPIQRPTANLRLSVREDGPSLLLIMLTDVTVPIVGVRYVREFQLFQQVNFHCMSCDCNCDSASIKPHLISTKHRMRYLRDHHPDVYELVKSHNGTKMELAVFVENICADVEKEVGRGKPVLGPRPLGPTGGKERRSEDEDLSKKEGEADKQEEEKSKPEETEKKDAPRGEGAAVKHGARPAGQDRGRAGPAFPYNRKVYRGKLPHDVAMAIYEEDKRRKELGGPPPPGWEPERRHHFLDRDPYLHEMRGPEFPPVRAWTPYMSEDERQRLLFELERGFLHDLPISLHPEEARCAMFPHYEKLGLPFEVACERVAMQEERRSRLMEYMSAGLSLQEALHKITAVENRKQLIREYEQQGLPPREARWRAIVEEERSGLLEEYASRGVNPLEVRARIMTGEERANLVGRFEKHGMPPAEAERRAIDEEERLKAIENSLQRGLVEEQGGGGNSMLDNVRDKWLLENHMEQGLSREKAENKVISHLRQEGVPTQAAILRVQRVTVQVPDPTSTHVDTSTAEAVSGTSKPVIDYRNLSPGKAKKHLLEEFEAGGVPREQALQILIRELVQTGMPEQEARQRFGEAGLAGEQAGDHKTKSVACVPTPSRAYSDIVSDSSRSPSYRSSPSYGSRSSSRSRSRSLSRGHHYRGLLSADSRSRSHMGRARSFSSGSRGWGSSTGRRKRHRSRSSDSSSRESRRKHHRRRSNSGSRGQSFEESSRRSRVKGHRSRSPSLTDDDRPPRHKQRARSHMEVDEGRADLHREVTRRDSRGDLETGQTEASSAEGAVDMKDLRKNVIMELIKSGMPSMTVLQLFSQQLDQTAGGQDSGCQDTGPQQSSSSHTKVAQSTVSEIDSLYKEWKDRGGNTGHRQKSYRARDDTDSSDSDADDRSRVSRRGGDRDGRGRNRDYSFTDEPNSDKKKTAYLGSHRNRMIAPRQETESSESDGNDGRRERPDPADSKAGQSQKHAGTSKLIVFDMKSDNFSVKKKPVKPVNVFGLTAESDSEENAEEGGGGRWRTAAGKKLYRDLTVTVHNSSAPAESSIQDRKDTRDNHERERSNLDKDDGTLRRGRDRGRDSTDRDGNGRGKDERTAPGSRDRRDWRDRRGSRERRDLGDTMDVSNRRERVRRDRSNSRVRKYGKERVGNDNWTVWLDKGDHRASRVWSDKRDQGNRRDRSNSRDRSHRRDRSNSRDRRDQRDGRDRRDQRDGRDRRDQRDGRDRRDQRDGRDRRDQRDGRDRRDQRDGRDRRDQRDSRDRRDRRNSWDRRECGNNRERQVHRDVSDRKRVDSTATRWRGGPWDARNQPGKGDARHWQTGYHLQGRRWEQAAKESGGGSFPQYSYDDSSRAISTAPPTHTATMAQHFGFPVGAPIPPTPAEGAYPPAWPQQLLPFWAATQPTLGAAVPAPHRIFPIHVPTQPIFPICAPTQPTTTADRPTQMTAVQQESTQSTPIPTTATGPAMGALFQLADSYSLEETTGPDASETAHFKESSSLEETTGPNVSEPMQLAESSSLEGATGPNTCEPVQLAKSSLEGATGPNTSEPVQLAESSSLEGATGPNTSEPVQLAESLSLEETAGPNTSDPVQLAENHSLEGATGPNTSEPIQLAESSSLERATRPNTSEPVQLAESSSLEGATGPNTSEPVQLAESTSLEGATGPNTSEPVQLAESLSLEETAGPNTSEPVQLAESHSLEGATGPNTSEPIQLAESSSLEGATRPNTSEPVQLAESSSLEGATRPNTSEPVQLAESSSLEGATRPNTSEPVQLAESSSLEGATRPNTSEPVQLAESSSLEGATRPNTSEPVQLAESSSLEGATGPNTSEPMQLAESSSLEETTGPNTSEPVQLAESSSLEGATGPNTSEPMQLAESSSLEETTGPNASEPIQLAESHSLEGATGPVTSEPMQLAESHSLEATAGPNVSEPVQQIPVLQRRCSDSAEPKQGPAKRKARKGQKKTWAQIQAKRKEMKAKQGISTQAKKKAEQIQKKAEQIQEKAKQIQEKAEPQMTEVQTKKAPRKKAKKTTPVPVETYVLKDDPPEVIAGSLAERLGKSLQDFTDATLHDSTMANYRAQAKTGQPFPRTDSSKPTFEQVNGVIVRHHYHRKEKLQAKSIVVPKEFREQAILINHQKPDGQHRILKSTVELVAYQYFWPKLHFEVKQFVRNCTLCKGKKLPFESLVVVRK